MGRIVVTEFVSLDGVMEDRGPRQRPARADAGRAVGYGIAIHIYEPAGEEGKGSDSD
jgi:hypothetical protein